MGIDVWTLRVPSKVGALELEQSAIGVGDVTAGPEFHLCFLNYRSFAICLSLGTNEEVISNGARRFCDDVALALNGSVLNPGIKNLKWPMRDGEDHSAAAAESVVSQRVNGLPGLMLIFGDVTASLIPGVAGAVPDQMLELNGRQFLLLNSIDQLCRGASGKRSLWHILQQHKKS